ncbi:cupin domain-containing protein [Glycomyces tritici]|uniref:Cupin domain-containing protein n=1 Tax=Glycomyces tritici TaxID=2665176 RepID=A0ABT7YKX0_9ACTN|nr:cupin domain-containing protein [Glycomyces tritici]MDN3239251.1 cupin domain-containing protein [Glycomyces tritici]
MSQLAIKSFNNPDESVDLSGHGHREMVMIDGMPVERAEFTKGWRWSNDVKPMVGTDSCEVHHLGYCLEGHLMVHMNDGTDKDISAGDAFDIPPGHDAEVMGDDKVVLIDFGKAHYSK